MSKIIKLTPELIEAMKMDFAEQLGKARLFGSSFNYSKSFSNQESGKESGKATLRFTSMAWDKMHALVAKFDKEVAWHCTAERLENNVYQLSDVLVYPQKVTSATVEMDEIGYAKWIQSGIEAGDERFDHLYCQGHSHVNMGCSPSSTDLDHQRKILEMMRDTGFYVFLIWNKKGEYNAWIYDLGNNICFEKADIQIEVEDDSDSITKFLAEAKSQVVDTPPVTRYAGSGAGYANTYGAYGGYSGYSGSSKPASKETDDTSMPKGSKQKVKAIASKSSAYSSSYDFCDYRDPFYYSDRYYGLDD